MLSKVYRNSAASCPREPHECPIPSAKGIIIATTILIATFCFFIYLHPPEKVQFQVVHMQATVFRSNNLIVRSRRPRHWIRQLSGLITKKAKGFSPHLEDESYAKTASPYLQIALRNLPQNSTHYDGIYRFDSAGNLERMIDVRPTKVSERLNNLNASDIYPNYWSIVEYFDWLANFSTSPNRTDSAQDFKTTSFGNASVKVPTRVPIEKRTIKRRTYNISVSERKAKDLNERTRNDPSYLETSYQKMKNVDNNSMSFLNDSKLLNGVISMEEFDRKIPHVSNGTAAKEYKQAELSDYLNHLRGDIALEQSLPTVERYTTASDFGRSTTMETEFIRGISQSTVNKYDDKDFVTLTLKGALGNHSEHKAVLEMTTPMRVIVSKEHEGTYLSSHKVRRNIHKLLPDGYSGRNVYSPTVDSRWIAFDAIANARAAKRGRQLDVNATHANRSVDEVDNIFSIKFFMFFVLIGILTLMIPIVITRIYKCTYNENGNKLSINVDNPDDIPRNVILL